MNIKLVLFNSSKNTYKLKNHKEDVGECVMRRQTWSGVSDVAVWRRSEYKLMNKMVFSLPSPSLSLYISTSHSYIVLIKCSIRKYMAKTSF